MLFSAKVFAVIAAGILTFPSVANAQCVAVRTYLHARPLIEDVITMELWHTGQKVCQQRSAKFFSDNEDFYQWDCPDLGTPQIKWRVRARENGKQISISTVTESGEVLRDYTTAMKNFKPSTWCAAWSDNGCRGWDSSYEACSFTPDFCNNGETCNLCDGKVTCHSPP
ncbi:hypothetical protein NW762_013397 [Fusarium torreyae]|uniref:Uncharacterized protein n=1 Tax=Fusarium torreyae TaxID=1237075 RepID=A0A9W8RNL5_9HYPO|nr:hypothetical protein NW762_013397 [Fusarium torreyae]